MNSYQNYTLNKTEAELTDLYLANCPSYDIYDANFRAKLEKSRDVITQWAIDSKNKESK